MKILRNTTIVCISLVTLAFVGCSNKDTYTVELEGNQDTGYSWNYEIKPTGIIQEKSKKFEPAKKKEKGEGAGTYIYEFEGVSKGEALLTFEYKKSWDDEEKPIDTRKIVLEVNEKKKIEEKK